MFPFSNKTVTDVWNSEVGSMKTFPKWRTSREQLADVLLLVLELDMS